MNQLKQKLYVKQSTKRLKKMRKSLSKNSNQFINRNLSKSIRQESLNLKELCELGRY